MNVKELFLDSILYEESALAHYIHHLVQEKKVALEDNITKLDLTQAYHQKVAEMIKNNVLGFHKIGIYSLKMNPTDFVFIFASNHQEAIQFYAETFQKAPLNCHQYPLYYEFDRGNEVVTFWDMRKEHERFPAVAGWFGRG